jgi:hypothetical protein
MRLATIDSSATEVALLNFTTRKYTWSSLGVVFVDGIKGVGQCNCITNYFTGKNFDYQIGYTGCGSAWYSYCEFKQPRGKNFK